MGGAEQQAMHGRMGQIFGKYTEEMFFEGDQHPLNPMRYLPTPFHTKFAQQRTALSQYIQQEVVGTRMRRWERPLHDFLLPYLRGAVARITGEDVIPEEVQHRRDLDTLVDMLQFLRAEGQAGRERHGKAAGTRSLPRRVQRFPARGGEGRPELGPLLRVQPGSAGFRVSGQIQQSGPVPGISCHRSFGRRGKACYGGWGWRQGLFFRTAGVTDLPPVLCCAPAGSRLSSHRLVPGPVPEES